MVQLRAALLAAGRGVRMGGTQPKALIPIGEHQPLLHYLLRGLRKAGVTDLVVVTGFGFEAVQSYVEERAEGLEVTFVRNARYASWGNFHSLRIALDASPGMDVLAINSDIVVPPLVFDRALAESADLVLAVQRRRGLEPEDMRVELDGTEIKAIGKDIKMVRSHAEFCGVSVVRPRAARVYGDVANALEWRAATTLYYEDVYALMLDRIEARASVVEEGEYAEVDAPEDAAAAAAVIDDHAGAWD